MTNSQLFNHGGPVLSNPYVYTIFWLPDLGTPGCASVTVSTPGCAVVSPKFQSTMNQFFEDLTGSALFNDLASQYPGSNGVSQSLGFGGTVTDTVTPYPDQGTSADPVSQSDLMVEIDRMRAANSSWGDGESAVYFIYTGLGVTTCFDDMSGCSSGTQPARSQDYCGYHSFYQHGVFGPYITFAHIPDDASCTFPIGTMLPNLPPSGSTVVDPVDFAVSVSSHEFFESLTDSHQDAWYGSGGASGSERASYRPGRAPSGAC